MTRKSQLCKTQREELSRQRKQQLKMPKMGTNLRCGGHRTKARWGQQSALERASGQGWREDRSLDQVGPKATATGWCFVKSVMASHSRVLSWEHLVLLICIKGNSECYLKNGLWGAKVEGGRSSRMLQCYYDNVSMRRWQLEPG